MTTLHEQSSAFLPAGPAAQTIADLGWLMVGVFGTVFVVVMFLVLFGIKAPKKSNSPTPPGGDKTFILLGGIFFPSLILIAFLIHTLVLTAQLKSGPSEAFTVRLTGHMWWWEVNYPNSGITSANEIYIPINTPVRIELDSKDVIHSLWVPSLSGKTDLLPGIQNIHWLQASHPGTYRGQCAEYCGLQHAWMAIHVVALPEDQFQNWITTNQKAVPAPQSPTLKKGLEAFSRVGCASCHTIQGTQATGKIGPDLTHVGSRLFIGAGKLKNNFGNLAGWIANPQTIKPGNKMPATQMEPASLHALVAYLMSLK